ncbi:hypothetical protein MCC93_02230 [Morococcus cerebrosus]|uniref:Uncharacterized protein n=1 Tax=Morococcus cerebrosus TaxID=1056807 RepID=A0A0C1EV29_9NEIS|nr:hypothetical protein MCC93_02230 [Morococcus cerebrosus]
MLLMVNSPLVFWFEGRLNHAVSGRLFHGFSNIASNFC